MKFALSLSLLALVAQQAVAIALPVSDELTAELAARHHHEGARGGQGGKFGGGFKGQGGAGAGGKGAGKGAAAAGAGAVAGAGAAVAAGGSKGTSTTSSAVIGASTSAAPAATTSVAAAAAAAAPPPPSNGGLSQAQITALQTSLTLDKSQVQPGLEQDGQAVPEAGQVPSLTSNNNFINFCATQDTTLTNGLQTTAGSCNPTIMGRILATTKLPSSKFTNPTNFGTIKANTTFTISMAINNMVTGNFVAAATNYYAAPCQVDPTGTVVGHSHVVVEKLDSLTQATVTNPLNFAFFKGLNLAAVNGVLTADVTGGVAPGAYRLASINTCANHQPVLASVAQHGHMDDMIYFTAE